MRNTWRHFFRRLAAGCVLAGSMAWTSAICYAVQLAYDSPDDPVYADGWQAGDNGGSGFTPWNFDSNILWQGTWYYYANPGIKAIDDGLKAGTHFSNPFNDIGKAWAVAQTPDDDGVNRVGRGFPALEPGQTFTVVVDNPTERRFYGGYFIRLNGGTGGMNGNICYNDTPCSPGVPTPTPKLNVRMFEFMTYGRWGIGDSGFTNTPLFDYHTAEGGMRLDITLTGPDSYDLVMTPLGNPALAYMQSGTFDNPGVPIDWFEITFFNTETDTGTPPTLATDFYIRSIEISGPSPPGVPGDYSNNGTVDAADYVLWRKHLGTSFQLENEVAGVTPGSVTPEDYDAWLARFGDPAGAGAGSLLAGMAVPEPGTFVLLVGVVAWCGFGRGLQLRRRQR